MLWKLTKLPFGIVEAGRNWMLAIEEWMLTHDSLEQFFGVNNQLFIRRSDLGRIVVMFAKLSDDFLVGSNLDDARHVSQRALCHICTREDN